MLIQILAIAPILATCSWLASVTPVLLRRRYALSPAAAGDASSLVMPFFDHLQATATPIQVTQRGGFPLVPLEDGRGNTHLMLSVPSPQTAGYHPDNPEPIVLMRFPDVIERGSRSWIPCLRNPDTVTTSVLINHEALPRLARQSLANARRASDAIQPNSRGTDTTPYPLAVGLSTGPYMFMSWVGITPSPDGGYDVAPANYSLQQICNIRPLPVAPITGTSPPLASCQTPVLDDNDQVLGYVNHRAVWGHHFVTSQDPQAYLYALRNCALQTIPVLDPLRESLAPIILQGDRSHPVTIYQPSDGGGVTITAVLRPNSS
jgi:hypothetical protein